MHPPGSLSYDDVRWCAPAREPPAEALIPFHPGINVLMILGAQKAGTTWLFNALTQHPSLHGADFGYMCACRPPRSRRCAPHPPCVRRPPPPPCFRRPNGVV